MSSCLLQAVHQHQEGGYLTDIKKKYWKLKNKDTIKSNLIRRCKQCHSSTPHDEIIKPYINENNDDTNNHQNSTHE